MEKIIEIVDTIDATKAYEELAHPKSGGICVFIGAVREISQQKKVKALSFESYENMALKEMDVIANEAKAQWDLNIVVLKHVVGYKNVKEPVVLVGASSPHRDDCFAACRFLIDTLKKRVPIWKKEFFEGEETVWVSPTP